MGADPFPGWQKGRRRREREPAGELAGRDEAGAEVAADSFPGQLPPGREEAKEAGYVAEMTCGPEWEGGLWDGGFGAGLGEERGRGRERILGEGPERERGPGGGAWGVSGTGAGSEFRAWNGAWAIQVGRSGRELVCGERGLKMGRKVTERQEIRDREGLGQVSETAAGSEKQPCAKREMEREDLL